MKWEYKFEPVTDGYSDSKQCFEELGCQGWELISVYEGIAYFKRPKIEHKKREVEYLGGRGKIG
jgi:hypothetical protein